MIDASLIAQPSYLKNSILNQVIAVTKASNAPKKMGAILLDKRNKLISSGINSYENTHTQQFYAAVMAANKYKDKSLRKKCYIHCELAAILKARKPANKIIICRVGGHGGNELRESFPCRICYLFIVTNCPTIKEIHWSTNDQNFKYIKLQDT